MKNTFQFGAIVLLFACMTSLNASRCKCHHPDKTDQTRWGGNEMVVEVPKKHYRQVAGIITVGGNGPTAGALVEMFDNPAYLLNRSGADHPPQKRLRACVTGDDGSFCFRKLPPGEYELRASLSSGIDVTHVYVVVDEQYGSNEPINVRLHLGT